MKWWSLVRRTWKRKPIGFILLSSFLVLFCLTVWATNSVMQASQGNGDISEASDPNPAQEQRARNLAISAAWQDPEVIVAFSEARESGDSETLDDAQSLLATRTKEINAEIADMRHSGMGWGEIAKHYGLHPSVLGLGHSRKSAESQLQISMEAHAGNETSFESSAATYPNSAQEQRARNVAIAAAWKDTDVIAAFSEAKKSEDSKALTDAKSLLAMRATEINHQISEMRASGTGWGEIAKHYGLHPSVLGLGNTKTKAQTQSQSWTQTNMQTDVSWVEGKTSKAERTRGNGKGRGGAYGSSNGRGHGGGRGGGHGGSHGGGHGGGKK